MIRKLVCSTLVAVVLGAFLAVIPVAAPVAQAADLPPVFSLKWGSNGTGNGQFNNPFGVAVDSSGDVYVADTSNYRIQKFSSAGAYLTQWGTNGTANGQFMLPYGVAVDASGDVYVADTSNNRIQKFTSAGTYLTQWGSFGTGDGQFEFPAAVAVDASGDVYVADSSNNRIQKFTSTGTYLTQWGTNGTGNGQFRYPYGVAVDSSGNVYVADSSNNRVQKFTSTGAYLTQWGTNGTGNGQFSVPDGVAVDSSGNVYVSDTYNNRMQKFTSTGAYLTQWGTTGTGNGQFQRPMGVAVDASGNVYVAEWSNHRVQKFVPPAPAVTIAKSADEGTVVAGAVIHYHVTVTNTGHLPLTGVTVTDTKAPACAGTLTDIAVGANRVVDCNYTSTPSDIGLYQNSATVDTNETDAVTSNTVNVNVTAAAQSEDPPVFVRTWGTSGSANGQFNQPFGVAVDASGNVYVADLSNDRVQKFSGDGTFVTAWGTTGSGDGQFRYPMDVTVDASGYVYVTDQSNNRVQKFTSAGVFVAKWGSNGTGDGQFILPQGVGVDASGNVFVSDWGNHRIQKFTSTGTYLGQWGTSGTGDGQFTQPFGVAVDSSGNVYVADYANNRVQKFTSTGTFLTKWGNYGTGNGQFNNPRGVAVDGDGDVYVADLANNRVQKFNSTGTFLTKWGTAGIGHSQFASGGGVNDLAVDGSGNVWVTDRSNQRVQQFAPVPTPSEAAPVFVRAWGSAGSGNGQFNSPDAVGVSPVTGDVYVADRGNHRVQQFTREGVFVRTWGTAGSANGQFNNPTGVAVNTAGDVYVSDKGNSRVQQFTATGTWVRTFGVGSLSNPEGIAVAPSGDVYVADAGNRLVRRFNATGAWLATIGSSGSANGQLSYAQGVAATDTAVYVGDTYNRRVQQFTPSGAYVRGWGVAGSGNAQFQEVDGLAVAPSGRVVVTDPNNTRLQAFTGTGTFVTTWGTAGTGEGRFVAPSPSDVAVSPDGWIYTVDRTNNRIQQFAPSLIRGTVTETGTATPLAGTWVIALRAADYHLLGGTTTGADGTYRLPVTSDAYRLEFVEPGFSHDIEWYDDHAWNQAGASDPVTATLGTTTTGIDAALNLPTGAISGTITQAGGGAPLADAVVAVISTVGDEHPYSATTTATDGTYHLTGLPPGTYKTVAALAAGTHQPWFHGNTGDINTAATAAVTPGATTPGIDIALPAATGGPAPTATLTGTATDQVTGDNEPDIVVAALRAADFGFTVATFTNTNGGYTLTVPPGDYYLEFFDITHGHEFEWYHDQPHPTGNTLTTVTAPATADEDLIPLHGTAAGTLTDATTSAPLPGIWVAVMGATDGHGVAGTTTDSAGHYTLPGLDLGDYYLVFIDPTGRHDYEFHDNTPDIGAATPITITGSLTTTTDAALTPTP